MAWCIMYIIAFACQARTCRAHKGTGRSPHAAYYSPLAPRLAPGRPVTHRHGGFVETAAVPGSTRARNRVDVVQGIQEQATRSSAVTACMRLRRAEVWRRQLHDGPAQRRMEGHTVNVTTYSSKHARGERTSFGDLLRRYRVAAGLSQEALAEQARMSARAISDLERGVHRLPYKDTVAQLATALGLTATERAMLEAAARGPRDAATADDRRAEGPPGAPPPAPAPPPPHPPPTEAPVPTWRMALGAAGVDVARPRDDYHVTEAPAAHRGRVFLRAHLPPVRPLLRATRAAPPLRLAQLR